MKFIFSIALLILFAGTFSLAEEKELVKIGLVVPLTASQADRGQDLAKAVKIFEPILNQRSKKYKYKFLIQDGKCGAGSAALNAANQLINFEKVKFLISGCSGETLQVGPLAEKSQVVDIAVLSTHQDVKTLGDYIFRTFIDIEDGFAEFAGYMSKESNQRIAVLTEENAFTFGIEKLLEKYLTDQIIFSEDYPADIADFRSLLSKVKQKNPGALYINALTERTLILIMQQARSMGINIPLYSYNMPDISSFPKLAGPLAEEVTYIGEPMTANLNKDFMEFESQFFAAFGTPIFPFLMKTFYDAVFSLFHSIEEVGPDSTKVKNYLYKISFPGATGQVEYDSNGDIKNLSWKIKRYVDGKPVALN